jgi:hypothetical protein
MYESRVAEQCCCFAVEQVLLAKLWLTVLKLILLA